jgi:hypothetical protein
MEKEKMEITYNEKINKTLDYYSPLKLHFWIMDNTVIMKVLDQDPRLCIEDTWFKVNDDIIFGSIDYIELNESSIYFRGIDINLDDSTTAITFKNELMAKKYVKFIKDVFDKIDFMKTEILVDLLDTEQNILVPIHEEKIWNAIMK